MDSYLGKYYVYTEDTGPIGPFSLDRAMAIATEELRTYMEIFTDLGYNCKNLEDTDIKVFKLIADASELNIQE